MAELLPFIVIGLVNGAIYAIAAMGLTLTYKTTGVFNFAYGAIAASAAYFFYELREQHQLAWPVAVLVTLGIFGVGVGLMFEQFGSLLARVSAPLQIAGTVGIMVAVQALIVIRYGSSAINFNSFLPTTTWQAGSTLISATQVITVSCAVVLGLGLFALLRFTSFGTTTRAVVDSPELLALTGRSPGRVRRWSWILGSTFSAASGILTAVVVGTLDPTILTLVLVQAFGAAAVGGFRYLGLAFGGGLLIGIVSAVTTYQVAGHPTLAGLPTAIPFLVLVLVLVCLPKSQMVSQRSAAFRIPPPPKLQRAWLRWMLLAGGTALVLLAPQLAGSSRLPSLTQALVVSLLFLSLGLLVHLSGQISLVQYGLAAVGAAAFSTLASDQGWPWLVSLVVAGLVAIPVGALVAIPAIRLSGLFLALATFGLGLVLQQMAYQSSFMFKDGFAIQTPRPGWASSQQAYYYLVAGVVAVCCVLTVLVTRSRLGRLLRGLAGSPVAVSTHGASLSVMKVLIFCISAYIAGIAGALMGPVTGSLNSTPFDPLASLTLLTVLFLAGGGTIRYAFVGGIALVLVPSYITDPLVNSYLQVLFGLSAIVIAGLAARTGEGTTPLMRRLRRGPRRDPDDAAPVESPSWVDGVPRSTDTHALNTVSREGSIR